MMVNHHRNLYKAKRFAVILLVLRILFITIPVTYGKITDNFCHHNVMTKRISPVCVFNVDICSHIMSITNRLRLLKILYNSMQKLTLHNKLTFYELLTDHLYELTVYISDQNIEQESVYNH